MIGVLDDLKGQVPRALVVLEAGVDRDPALVAADLVELVRPRLGAGASLRRVDVVAALPVTSSVKILGKTMRAMADGVDAPAPSRSRTPRCWTTSAPFRSST